MSEYIISGCNEEDGVITVTLTTDSGVSNVRERIIRCKDCKYQFIYQGGYSACRLLCFSDESEAFTDPKGFCSLAEPKEES